MKRSKPLVKVNAIFDHSWSAYPDRIKVPMDDGQVVEYEIVIKMPEPVLGKLLDQFDKVCLVGGYKYKEKGRRKRSGRMGDKSETGHNAEER